MEHNTSQPSGTMFPPGEVEFYPARPEGDTLPDASR
jgi:hypothetical protein